MKYICINKIKGIIAGLLFISLSFATTLALNNREMATKLEIETNLEEKVVNVISKIYDINKFAVTTNVLLVSPISTIDNINNKQSFGSLQLEGILPAVPQKSEGNSLINSNDYRVQIKDITIWLDYDLDIIDARNNIRPFLFKTMDWLSDCENCLQFQRTQFTKNGSQNISSNTASTSTSNSVDSEDISIIEDNITYLMDQLDKLNDSMNSDGYGNEKHQWMIDYLERNLQEEKDASSNLSDKLMSLQDRIISRDSSIIMNTTLGQKEIAQTAMQENTRIVEKNIDNQFENNRYMLIVLFILIGVVILLVILSFFNKGPKTVYLKPKGQNIDNSPTNTNEFSKAELNQGVNKNETDTQTSKVEPVNTMPTTAYADDSVIQSDLKNIRQSAVKMSVGQKHGASQIVKDWLDDGGESNEDNVDNKQDETEE